MRVLIGVWFVCMSLLCSAQISIKVIEVHDGDTFKIIRFGKKVSCRMTNIDAPELKQGYGVASRDSLRALILNKTVIVDSLGTDLYKRMLVSVKVNGKRLDSLMIRKGWAWQYAAYSNDLMLSNCMQNAINEHLGLWICGKEKVCPPWLYRKYNVLNKYKYCNECLIN